MKTERYEACKHAAQLYVDGMISETTRNRITDDISRTTKTPCRQVESIVDRLMNFYEEIEAIED